MAKSTKIEWADSGWSPWLGCTKISDGCSGCYAERETHGKGWGNQPRIRTVPGYWRQPLLWNADAPRFQREHGHRQRVFGDHICDYRLRWPILAAIPAVIRFVSYEPALGPLGAVDIGVGVLPDWIIVGGESGNNPREMDPQRAREVRDQCRKLNIAFFMKQMTDRRAIPPDLFVRQFPELGQSGGEARMTEPADRNG